MSRRVPKKEPYERPRVMKIVIAAEEMAAVGCKTARQRRGPTTGCVPAVCRLPGS